MKTAVLLHGYNVNEKNWEYVIWGISPDKPGRIPVAIATALEEDADFFLLFGSSMGKGGKSSGKWMKNFLYKRFTDLKKFTVLCALRDFPIDKIRRKIDATFELIEGPERPANTLGELQAMHRLIIERQIQKLICVSSADHVSRIIRDAFKIFWGQPIAAHLEVRGSLTLYTEGDGITPPERASVDHVIVAEPRATVGPYFERMFGIRNNTDALADIDAILKKHGQ